MLTRRIAQWRSLGLRTQIEAGLLAVIIACALSVFVTSLPWRSKISMDKGKMTYVGQLKRGKLDGKGTLMFENGDRYQGQFLKGQLEGKGTYTSASGWVYEGEFHKGQAHGSGKLTTEAKIVYEGQFKEGIYQDAN